jgi:hypothetical protein
MWIRCTVLYQVAALAVNANTATVLGSISASFDTMEPERWLIEAVLTVDITKLKRFATRTSAVNPDLTFSTLANRVWIHNRLKIRKL